MGRYPWPLNDGWKIRTFNLIKWMSLQGYVVDIVSYTNNDDELSPDELCKYCRKIFYIKRKNKYELSDLMRGLFFRTPFSIINYYSNEMLNKILDIVDNNSYDLIQVEDIVMDKCISNQINLPKILDMHNVESELMKRYSDNEHNILKKLYARLTASKLSKYEKSAIDSYNCLFVCSENDRKILLRNNTKFNIEIIPNGVDIAHYSYNKAEEEEENTLLFVGAMDYHANISGIIHFIRNIFPSIKERNQSVKLRVVGKNPPKKLSDLADESIEIIGAVNDVRPYLYKATVVIVPLLVGGGTRLKILEAMATKKAIVSTSVGCEGIPAINGETISIADTKEEFIDAIMNYLNNKTLRNATGSRAYNFVSDNFDWMNIVNNMCLIHSRYI